MILRPVQPDDLPAVLALNQANLPELGPLDLDQLTHLVGQSVHTVVGDDDGEVVAALLGLDGPGRDYASLNYAWFSHRYDRFLYVDRVVVASTHHGQGLGRRLYEGFIDAVGGDHDVLVAEVNVRPRNDASLAFHERMGFEAVGEQDTDDGAKRVRMLAKPLGGGPAADPIPARADPATSAADDVAGERTELAGLEGDVATVERLLDRFDDIAPPERSTMLDRLEAATPPPSAGDGADHNDGLEGGAQPHSAE